MAFEIDKVREIAERVAASSGLEMVEVELRGGGKARMLRIVIDKPAGVTHEDCANLSREVGTDPRCRGCDSGRVVHAGGFFSRVWIESYSGLADYERFTGSLVKLTTQQPVNGNRHFEGRLESFQQGRLTLDLGAARKKRRPGEAAPEKVEIDLANVEKANLVPEI